MEATNPNLLRAKELQAILNQDDAKAILEEEKKSDDRGNY